MLKICLARIEILKKVPTLRDQTLLFRLLHQPTQPVWIPGSPHQAPKDQAGNFQAVIPPSTI